MKNIFKFECTLRLMVALVDLCRKRNKCLKKRKAHFKCHIKFKKYFE